MVGNCEVTWAGPGWNKNKNDDGRDSDDRDDDGDDSFSFICMGLLHSVRWKWLDDHCDGDDLYKDHHGEFEPGGQGRGSNGQRHQVYKQKTSFSSLLCFIRTFMDGSIHHVLLFSELLGVQDKMDIINHHPPHRPFNQFQWTRLGAVHKWRHHFWGVSRPPPPSRDDVIYEQPLTDIHAVKFTRTPYLEIVVINTMC